MDREPQDEHDEKPSAAGRLIRKAVVYAAILITLFWAGGLLFAMGKLLVAAVRKGR